MGFGGLALRYPIQVLKVLNPKSPKPIGSFRDLSLNPKRCLGTTLIKPSTLNLLGCKAEPFDRSQDCPSGLGSLEFSLGLGFTV